MKVLHISDSHGFHSDYRHQWNTYDIIIHTGDASNSKNIIKNYVEMKRFLEWYDWVPCKHKIYVPGNHDTCLDEKMYLDEFRKAYPDITFLIDESVEIEGIKIYGTPWCPLFHQWAFMRKDSKLFKLYDMIPEDTDILATHAPPKSVLDLAEDRDGNLEYCGSKHLFNKVIEVEPKYHLFGHMHNNGTCVNAGVFRPSFSETTFINSSGVVDRKFSLGIVNQGNEFEI